MSRRRGIRRWDWAGCSKLSNYGSDCEASSIHSTPDWYSQGNARTFALISSGTGKFRLFAENG